MVGIAEDYLNAKLVTGYISQDNLRNDFHESADLLVLADRKTGADPVRVQRELRKVVSKYPTFTLFDFAEWRQSQADIFVQAFAVYYILVAAIALPGLLALVNTLAMAILERTREIGMLRAVGTTRRQVITMVLRRVAHALDDGDAPRARRGDLDGILARRPRFSASGFPLHVLLPVAGDRRRPRSPASLFGVIAALVPPARAARLKIVDALAWE